jgi:hypothetical protein
MAVVAPAPTSAIPPTATGSPLIPVRAAPPTPVCGTPLGMTSVVEVVDVPPTDVVDVPPTDVVDVPPTDVVDVPPTDVVDVPPTDVVDVPPRDVVDEVTLVVQVGTVIVLSSRLT